MAITPIFCCGFECGITGSHWSLASGVAFDTSTKNNGARSLRIHPAASQQFASGPALSVAEYIVRFYIKVDSNPTASCFIAGGFDATAGNTGLFFKSTDSKFYAGLGATLGATGATLSAGWHRVDMKISDTANTVDVQIDGVALGQATGTMTGLGSRSIGDSVVSISADYYIDDWVDSATAADYPIGPGKVLSFVPAADGTHTFTTTHAILGTTGAPTTGGNITSATTTAFGYVNNRPIGGGVADATRLWNQATAAAAEYAEVTIEQTTETSPPRAVEVLCIAREASTTGCNSTFKINDGGTESTVYAMTTPAGNVDEFKTKQFAVPPTANGIVDSYSETNKDGFAGINLTNNQDAVGQAFTGNGGILGSATFFLQINLTPTGNAVYRVYASSGTFGTNAIPTGAVLAESDPLDVSTLTATYTLITLNFTGANQIQLVNGTKYVITCEYTGTSGFAGVNVGSDSSSPTHAGNRSTRNQSSGVWTGGSTVDFCFYVRTVNNWTLASSGPGSFLGLRLRFGYSSDATPDVYCRGWMVEAEFPVIATPSTIPNKIFSTMQAVTRSNYY